MLLTDLGYTPELEKYRVENGLETFTVGRVIAEHKERYILKTPEKELEIEIPSAGPAGSKPNLPWGTNPDFAFKATSGHPCPKAKNIGKQRVDSTLSPFFLSIKKRLKPLSIPSLRAPYTMPARTPAK